MPSSHTRLSRREREIVHAVFALDNRASAEDIRRQLPDPPSYSAVRAMLVRLETKGVLRHDMDGARYIYSATTSPTAAKRAALKQYLSVFFRGSAGELVTALLRQERWSDDELERLRAEIDRIRQERHKP
jgi:BlaI family transcriptional regulator, penicillinase repressor